MLRGLFNLSDAITKRKLLAQIGAMIGPYRIEIAKHYPGRSTGQNNYFHGTVVPAFIEYERQQGVFVSEDQAKVALKLILMPDKTTEIINHATGEVIRVPGESSKLDTEEFSARLIEGAITWFADMGVILPPPERDPAKRVKIVRH